VKPERAAPKKKPELEVPADLTAALGKSAKARKALEGFSPSHRREYVEWITEAKREATARSGSLRPSRSSRRENPRNWTYM
jgi:uncharacterized protein YdeI (YjbR/CyaY-like superfamily)